MKDSMTCEVFEGLLPRYLEGEAGDAERRAAEAHAAGCNACGALLAGVREITREAGALPVLEPSRDLWDGIAARIEAPAIPLASRRGMAAAPATGMRTSHRGWMAAAAAALVIATAGVTHVATRQMMGSGDSGRMAMVDVAPEPATFVADTPPASAPLEGAPAGAEPDAAAPVPAAPRTTPRQAQAAPSAATGTLVSRAEKVEAVYDQEIAALQQLLENQRAELDPATAIVLENNLRIIDRAIQDSRSALARDPASGFLTDQLTMALDKKLQLMRTAAKLPTRT